MYKAHTHTQRNVCLASSSGWPPKCRTTQHRLSSARLKVLTWKLFNQEPGGQCKQKIETLKHLAVVNTEVVQKYPSSGLREQVVRGHFRVTQTELNHRNGGYWFRYGCSVFLLPILCHFRSETFFKLTRTCVADVQEQSTPPWRLLKWTELIEQISMCKRGRVSYFF